MQRANISIGIVCMINQTALDESHVEIPKPTQPKHEYMNSIEQFMEAEYTDQIKPKCVNRSDVNINLD
jgi:hypothetical protein